MDYSTSILVLLFQALCRRFLSGGWVMSKKCLPFFLMLGLLFVCPTVSFTGELDSAFGVDGRVALEIGTYGDRAQAVVLQDDGKILLGGSSTNGESLSVSFLRLLPDGSPDPEFNGDGTAIINIGDGDDEILALAMSPDGNIVAGGYTDNGRDRDFLLMRFLADGSLDTDFGRHGFVSTSVGNSDDEITALVVDKNGNILVTGNAAGTNGRVLVLAKYLADGHLDSAFADRGLSLTGVGTDALAQGMVVGDDGRIVVSGSYTDGKVTRIMLAGFTRDGQLDRDFGTDGIATTLNRQDVSEGYGMYASDNGDLYVAGSLGTEGRRAAALFRFTANGRVDASFGDNGVLVTEIGPEDDVLYSLAGNATSLNAAGFTTTNGNREFLLITYDRQTEELPAPAELPGKKNAHLHIRDLQVKESLASFKEVPVSEAKQLLPAVVTTSFGEGESVSYGVAVQKDGKVVTVGTIGDDGRTSAGVARFAVPGSSAKSLSGSGGAVDNNVNITTLPITDIKATGAFSGGNINAALGAVTQRGVVFSIAPFPVCKGECAKGGSGGGFDGGGSGGGGGDGGGGGGTDTTAPVITNTTPSSFGLKDNVILSVTTNEAATCKFNIGSDLPFEAMTETMSGSAATSHAKDIGPQSPGSHTSFVRCEDNAGNKNSSGTGITFTVGTATSCSPVNTFEKTGLLLADASEAVGNFLLPSAHAQAVISGATQATTNTSSSSSLKLRKEGFTNDGAGTGLYSSIMEDMAPDTRYYVRAYAIVGDVVYYGPQVVFETSTACFIATAAYGSLLDPAVVILREFRDHYLKTNFLGRKFVTWYYTHSPPLADRIAASPRLRFATRILLVPLIGAGWLALHPPVACAGLLLIGFFVFFVYARFRQRISSIPV